MTNAERRDGVNRSASLRERFMAHRRQRTAAAIRDRQSPRLRNAAQKETHSTFPQSGVMHDASLAELTPEKLLGDARRLGGLPSEDANKLHIDPKNPHRVLDKNGREFNGVIYDGPQGGAGSMLEPEPQVVDLEENTIAKAEAARQQTPREGRNKSFGK
jgi:hypothetical protein